MPRYSVAGRATVVGTNLRAIASLFATTGVRPVIREIGVFNTTTTAVAVAVARFTVATNVGAALTVFRESDTTHAAVATPFAGHTGDTTSIGASCRQASLGAAVGSGVIWTWGDLGLPVATTTGASGTADGIGIIIPTGTGQICDYYIVWDE